MRLLAQAEDMPPHDYQTAQAFAQWLIQVGDGDAEIMNADGTTTLPEGTIRSFAHNLTLYRVLSSTVSA